MKKIYYYSGNFNMSDYYKRTFLVSVAEVFLIALGTALMLYLNSSLPLLLSLLILTASLTWYIVSHAPFISALYSVFVLDEDESLWHITVMPGRTYAGPNSSVPNVEGAVKTSQNRAYIEQFVEDIKNGKKRYNIWSGGNRYTKLIDYRLKRETEKFIYVEAMATTRRYKSKLKTFKFVKQYGGITELLQKNNTV